MDGDLLAVRNIDYNPFGEAVTIWSETNQLSTRSYDRLGRVVAVTESVRREGSTKIDTYDAYAYDALGQQIRHVQYAGATARTGPGANDLVTRTDYDGMGRAVSTVSAAGLQTRYEYTTATVDGLRGQSTIGTAKVTYQADGRSLADRSDYFGHVTQHNDLSGNVTLYVYDAAARLSRQTSTVHAGQTQGQSIHYAYYANGALKSQVDAVVLTCTEWLYDDAGNRTGEAYYAWAGGRRVGLFQSNTVTYDEHNRMVRAAEGSYYSVSYEYDAVGNRRLADASYWDDVAGARKQQTYWYKYNNLNHITIAKGMLAGADGQPHARATGTAETGAEIIAGAYGTALAYNALGERVAAIYRATDPANPTVPGPLVTELYTTDGQGHVLRVLRDGREVLERTLDAAGRTLAEEDRSNASQLRLTGYIYDADNRLQKQVVGTAETTFFYENGTAAPSATGAGPLMRAVTTQGGQQSTTTYTYDYWDEARQKTVQKTDAGGSGTTVLTYNANGHLVRTVDQVAGLTTTFFNSANGLVLQREREQRNVAVGSHVFFYAAGRRVGEIRNDPQDEAHPSLVLDQQGQTPRDNNTLSSTFRPVVTADFDQNYEPFNLGTPGNAATYYTVRAGDTLAGVALQVWGNASLWYLIAEANGLSGTEALQPGQLLRLPNGITNIHNNSQTLRPYNPAEVIGDVDPTVSRPPPPPDLRCGAFSTIIGVVVNAVVSFYTLNPALGAVAGDAARQYSSAALNGQLDYKHFVRESAKMMLGEMIFGPLGSLGQFLSDPKHPPGFKEHSYDYQSTLIAGAAGLASQGMSAVAANWSGWGTYARAAAQAAASNATSQYLAVAMGRADDFSWRAVAASALGAAAGHGVSGYLEGTDWGSAYENLGANAGGNWVGGVVEQRLLPHEQRDYPGVFAGTVGGIIGDGILAGPRAVRREQQRADNRSLLNQYERDSNPADYTTPQPAGSGLRVGGAGADPVRLYDATTAYGLDAQDLLTTGGGSQDWPVADLEEIYGDELRTADFIPGLDDGQFVDAGGSLRPGSARNPGYNVVRQFELAVNNRTHTLYEALGEFAQLGDYQRASNSDFDLISEWMGHNGRGDIIEQIRAEIGQSGRRLPDLPTRHLPSLIDPAFAVEVSDYSATELAKHLEYGRRWALAKQGTITLGADFSIETIGKNRLTPNQFAEQLQQVYERAVATAAPEAEQRLANKKLFVNYLHFDDPYVAEQIAKGNYVDRLAKQDVTAWLSAQGVPDSPYGIVSVGRRFSEVGNPINYRMPDLLVRYGPGDIFALDATLGTKTATTPQVRDTLNYGASKWGNVTVSGTQWISNPKLVPLLPRKN